MTNPNSLLEGYAPIYGEEGDNPSLRTRMNAMELAKGNSTNKFSIEDIKEISLANRSITASLVTKEVTTQRIQPPKQNRKANSGNFFSNTSVIA